MIFKKFSNKKQLIWILDAKVMAKTILIWLNIQPTGFRCSSFLSVLFVLSLGSDDSLEPESDPLQQTSDLQQGKQYSIHLIILLLLFLKSNILFAKYCMHAAEDHS